MTSISAILALAAIAGQFEAVEPHMGTLVRIKLYAADAHRAREAFHAAFARIEDLDQALSDYREDSELNRLCRARSTRVSADLLRVLSASQDLARDSDGAFDVTQGPVIRLWREARKTRVLPDVSEARRRSGWTKLHVGETTVLDVQNMQLDLGGIAKGYAADEALATLGRLGIESAMVAMSGDIAVSHAPPGERGWKIRLDAFDRVMELSDAAVSTSGDAEQFVEIGGVRYSHIIDPLTGMALTNGVTASVIARRGIDADGIATAVCVLGVERGLQLGKRRGVQVFVKQ
jgi:thiamine biosynthesis lipoprotein